MNQSVNHLNLLFMSFHYLLLMEPVGIENVQSIGNYSFKLFTRSCLGNSHEWSIEKLSFVLTLEPSQSMLHWKLWFLVFIDMTTLLPKFKDWQRLNSSKFRDVPSWFWQFGGVIVSVSQHWLSKRLKVTVSHAFTHQISHLLPGPLIRTRQKWTMSHLREYQSKQQCRLKICPFVWILQIVPLAMKTVRFHI